jgi:Trk K+ transport system NAD-binding subunit
MIRDVLIEAPWGTQTFDLGKLTSLAAVVGPADAGKRVEEVEEPGRVRIAAVRRGADQVMVASSDLRLELGDELSAIVAPAAISDFAQRFPHAAPRSTVPA